MVIVLAVMPGAEAVSGAVELPVLVPEAVGEPEPGLHRHRGRRERVVRRGRRENDEVEFIGRNTGMVEGSPRRLDRQVRCQLSWARDVPLANTCPLRDQRVARVDAVGQFGIGDNLLRKERAASDNNGT